MGSVDDGEEETAGTPVRPVEPSGAFRSTRPGGIEAARMLAPARRTIGGFPAAALPKVLADARAELEKEAESQAPSSDAVAPAERRSEPPSGSNHTGPLQVPVHDTGPPPGISEMTIASDADLPMPIPDATPPDFEAPPGAPTRTPTASPPAPPPPPPGSLSHARPTDPAGIPNASALGIVPPPERPATDPEPALLVVEDPPEAEPAPEPSRALPIDFDAAIADDDDEDDPFLSLSKGSSLGGRYRLERILGKGATGVVFEASHLVIGKRVAVKCLYPHHRATPVAVERFFQEARIAATVEHPNVIQIFDGGDEKDTLFLAMELLEGTSLADRIDDDGPMPLGEAVRIFLAIMSGVAAVHEAGVVHRDLKPDNIFLQKTRFRSREEPKVLDFGISKLKQPGKELTSLGVVMGTPTYMAPEQVASTRDVDVRADVYSLGVMLYEALAGDVPYDADSVLDIFRAAEAGDAQPLNEIRSDVSVELAQIIAKAMDAKIGQRYESVAEFAAAIRELPLEITDPEKQAPRIPDIRATVRDLPAPIRDQMTHIKGESTPTPRTRSNAFPIAEREEEKRTVALAQPTIVERTPRWVYAALAGAGALTFAAILIALVAVLR